MSASSKPVKKKEKKKPLLVKTSLNTPYSLQWRPLEKQDLRFVLSLLKDKMAEVGLRKREPVGENRRWRPKRKGPSSGSPALDSPPGGPPEAKSDQGWTDTVVRKQLAIGINEVTRALERNELCLVLVCRSVKPPHMTSHLIGLSQTRAVPACQVPRLSESMASLLGLKCVLALGFRRGTETFSQAVAAILPKVPAFQGSWVPLCPEGRPGKSDPRTGDQEDATEDGDPVKSRKRKLEETSLDMVQTEPTPLISLQPLKVKKIVPNPTKIRKPKKMKKSVAK